MVILNKFLLLLYELYSFSHVRHCFVHINSVAIKMCFYKMLHKRLKEPFAL